MLPADDLVALDSDGSFFNKKEYLAGIAGAGFQPSQAVNEQNIAHVYGDTVMLWACSA